MDWDNPREGALGDIAKKLQDHFHLSGLRVLAEHGFEGQDKLDALKVMDKYKMVRANEERDYQAHYQDRVATVAERIINQRGSKTLEHQPRSMPADHFSKSAIMSQAAKEVRHAHRTTLSLYDEQERRDLQKIAERADRMPEADRTPPSRTQKIERNDGPTRPRTRH